MNYTPLYIKTEYSLLKSLIKIDDLIVFAKENNIKSLGIADNNMCGVIEFYNKCKNNGIKPIIGLEVDMKVYKIVLYAKNNNGYNNLLKINTYMSNNELNIDVLNKYLDNLICIIPCEYIDYKDKINCDNIYIGFKNKEEELKIKDNKIYLNEINCLYKDDIEYIKYLHAIKENTTIDKIELKNDNYMLLENELPHNLDNNYKISEICNVEIKKEKNHIPKYNCPNDLTSYEYLKELCKNGLKRIFGDTVGSKYIEQLKHELEIIKEMNFCDYFLIVADYVNFAKKNNIMVGPGRGSATGSLVSYVLNITEIDPMKYDLLFERFLNKDRVTLPDIDIDFDGNKIEEVIDYCKNKYGSKCVMPIITYSSLTSKQVIRDVGSALGINDEEINYFTKMFKAKLSLQENLETSYRIKNHLEKNPELKKVFEISKRLENIKKHISQHASGIIISDEEIDNIIPILSYKDEYLAGFEASYLEDLGLIKMDFLSLKTLSIIDEILNEAKIDFRTIPLNDINTIKLFNEGKTLGIFQFESSGMINFLRQFKVKKFDELINVMALYRPGPMQNINSYVKRRAGIEEIDYYDITLEPILKPTNGIIVYQEQIMQIAHIMANYSLKEADNLRVAIAKKKQEKIIKEKDKFITRSIENGYKEEMAKKIYDLILKFSEYGFPKAHAVAYTTLSYKMAYLKANYPLVFFKNMLNNAMGSIDTTKEYIVDLKTMNIKIEKPSINQSDIRYEIKNEKIIYPFTNIKKISFNVANNIIMNRKDNYKDIFDFITKIDLKIVNKDILTNLILSGVFDEFNINRKTLINNLDVIYNYAELVNDLNDINIEKPELIIYDEYTENEILNFENQVYGFYLNKHPVIEYRKKYNIKISLNSIMDYVGKRVKIIAHLDQLKNFKTKNDKNICFIKISDEYTSLDGTIFENAGIDVETLKIDSIVLITGKPNRRNNVENQIIIDDIKIID